MNKRKPTKFVFRQGKRPSGTAGIGFGTPTIDIMYAGVYVGRIEFNDGWNRNHDLGIQVWFQIPEKQENCWKWASMKNCFQSAEEAKEYLNENFDMLKDKIYIQEN